MGIIIQVERMTFARLNSIKFEIELILIIAAFVLFNEYLPSRPLIKVQIFLWLLSINLLRPVTWLCRHLLRSKEEV